MCRSDVQLIDGYFQEAIKPKFPIRLNSNKGTKLSQDCDSGIVGCPLDADSLDSLLIRPVRSRPVLTKVRVD